MQNNYIKIGVMILFMAGLSSCGFPKYEDLKVQIDRALALNDSISRKSAIQLVLESIRNPQSPEDDSVVASSIDYLVIAYKKNADSSILDAVDSVHADGGFANDLCGFYPQVKDMASFKERYKVEPFHSSLKRCVGLSLSEEEFNEITASSSN